MDRNVTKMILCTNKNNNHEIVFLNISNFKVSSVLCKMCFVAHSSNSILWISHSSADIQINFEKKKKLLQLLTSKFLQTKMLCLPFISSLAKKELLPIEMQRNDSSIYQGCSVYRDICEVALFITFLVALIGFNFKMIF